MPRPTHDDTSDQESQKTLRVSADLPRLLSVEEVAEWLGISETAIRKRLARGTLPGVVRVGRSIRFNAGELSAWVKRGQGSLG